ncbi:TetR/AcrR family transcriptional regulator [Mumia flava]|nr:TetR/AcrR family transcriptional regulator [Mumia flava]
MEPSDPDPSDPPRPASGLQPARIHEWATLPPRTPLPRGRSALPPAEVAESQRGRILHAIVEETAERGYAATSVQHVTARARVSRTAFYQHFSNKEDAFATAHLNASRRLLDIIAEHVAQHADQSWRVQHRAGVTGYLTAFAGAPSSATAFLVELLSAGDRLLDQRDMILGFSARGLSRLAELAHADHPDRPLPSSDVTYALAAAADALMTREVRAGRTTLLLGCADEIVAFQAAVLAGS